MVPNIDVVGFIFPEKGKEKSGNYGILSGISLYLFVHGDKKLLQLIYGVGY